MTPLEHMARALQVGTQLMDRFPGTTLAEDRREEAREKQRESEEREFNQIVAPLDESLTLLRETARELLRRTAMVPYLSAERDCRGEAEYILDAIEAAGRSIKRSIKDAVEV